MSDRKLTESEKAMARWFWYDKGSLDKWSDWETLLPLFKKEIPELADAWEAYKRAEQMMDLVIESMAI